MRACNTPEAGKPACGCEADHSSSGLPQRTLIVASGLLTGVGLALKWMGVPGLWQTASFALATAAGGALVFPAAWKALRKLKHPSRSRKLRSFLDQ